MRFHADRVNRNELDIKRVLGGLLVQTPDLTYEDPHQGKVVTRRAPTEAELRALALGIRVCKHVKSNAVAFVKEDRTLAVGGGATSRIDPVFAAREKAARLGISLAGSVLASEALFPLSRRGNPHTGGGGRRHGDRAARRSGARRGSDRGGPTASTSQWYSPECATSAINADCAVSCG